MTPTEPSSTPPRASHADDSLFVRQFERDAIAACLIMAAAALVWPGGGAGAAAAVVGGGVLAALSYRPIKAAVLRSGGGTPRVFTLVKFFTRYAILAVAAYVMLARLRLHPVGVLGGASSLVVAAMVAAARALGPRTR